MRYSHIIIGGGIYGCYTALTLAKRYGSPSVLIIEQEPDLLRRASYNNQARVHNGYHYPRSLLTALRSRVNAPRFVSEFSEAIFSDFVQYYAISRRRSNVTAGQFEQFCRRIGAEIMPTTGGVRKLFDSELIEAVFRVREPAFDADLLRDCFRTRIQEAGIALVTETKAIRVTVEGEARSAGQRFRLETRNVQSGGRHEFPCEYLYNCTYSRLNGILARSGMQPIRLKHEATEMALVEVPASLSGLSITVMCGPFFSLMPFPPLQLATLSHVSYTPHYEWPDDPLQGGYVSHKPSFPLRTRFDRMRRDATRYVPALKDCRYVRSIWEVKTVLPQSGVNDSRPILFKRDPSAPNLISLLGSKIDNIFDLDGVLPNPGGEYAGSDFAGSRRSVE
jgi:glycine/D-amino acid oxidase-like deaminating enzyme